MTWEVFGLMVVVVAIYGLWFAVIVTRKPGAVVTIVIDPSSWRGDGTKVNGRSHQVRPPNAPHAQRKKSAAVGREEIEK